MRLNAEFKPNDAGADIYMMGAGADPTWMLLRWNMHDNRISGYLGSPARDGLPPVRPVTYESNLITPQTVGSLAVWVFMSATNMHGAVAGQIAKVNASDRLNEWESFLSGKTDKKDAKTENQRLISDPDSVFLTKDQLNWMMENQLIRETNGTLLPVRKPSFSTGATISGFQAITIRDAIAKIFPAIPHPKIENLAAAQTALRAVSRPSSLAVHWYGSATGQLADDRAQAAASYPVLAGMIADNPFLSRSVDNRQPLMPELIETLGLSKGSLKRLSGLTKGLPVGKLFEAGEAQRGADALGVNRERRFPVSGELSLGNAIKVLSELPPDRVPQDDKSWMLFHDIVAGCAVPIENTLGIPVAQTLSACKGDWVQFHALLAKAADFEPKDFDRRTMALTTIDALEAIEDFSRTAVLPLALSAIESTEQEVPEVSSEFFTWSSRTATRICIGNAKSQVTSLFEMARRYASRIPALYAATADDIQEIPKEDLRFAQYGPEGFPRLHDDFIASNDRVVRCMNSFALMRRETERLKHCVGGTYHTTNARNMAGHYFSIQNRDGSVSYSTMRISAMNGETAINASRKFSVEEHRAKGNAAIDKESQKAQDEWLLAMRSGQLNINFNEINAWRAGGINKAEIQQAGVTWKGVIGMDWRDAERRQAAWEEWRYIMGGQFGKSASAEAIFREQGARDLVAAMNPKAAALLIERQKIARAEAQAALKLAAEDATLNADQAHQDPAPAGP